MLNASMNFSSPSSHPGFTKLGSDDIVPTLSVGMLQGSLLRPDLNRCRKIVAGVTKTGANAGALAP